MNRLTDTELVQEALARLWEAEPPFEQLENLIADLRSGETIVHNCADPIPDGWYVTVPGLPIVLIVAMICGTVLAALGRI